MQANEYQNLALRTQNRSLDYPQTLATCALGLTGEAGEVADHVKKYIGHGQSLDLAKVKKELGDVLWYISVLSASCGFTLEEVMQCNVDKLRARWPEGFDVTLPQAAGDGDK